VVNPTLGDTKMTIILAPKSAHRLEDAWHKIQGVIQQRYPGISQEDLDEKTVDVVETAALVMCRPPLPAIPDVPAPGTHQ